MGEHIYIIGSLRYQGTRRFGETPVYRLNTRTLAIERLTPAGVPPGWIYKHRAVLSGAEEIRVSGGKIAMLIGGEETHTDNTRCFALDIGRLIWRPITG